MRKTRLIALLSFAMVFQLAIGSPFVVVDDGMPIARIAISEQAHPGIVHAAEELQRWIQEITGATLQIVGSDDAQAGDIVLCTCPEGFDDDLASLNGTDGYAVRPRDGKLLLFGLRPRAVLNGVFRILFKNTDIIWARPSETYFTKTRELAFVVNDYVDKPALQVRALWGGDYNSDGSLSPEVYWAMRNCTNMLSCVAQLSRKHPYDSGKDRFDQDYCAIEGHPLTWRFIAVSKYKDTHPEFFSLVGGRRVFDKHLCYSNEDMFAAFVQELDEELRLYPETIRFLNIAEADVMGGSCECGACNRKIMTRDGVLEVPTPSTKYFLFLNKVARWLKEHHPGKRIITHAYFATETAPQIELEDNIIPDYCPIFQNMKRGLEEKEDNEISNNRFRSWFGKVPGEMTSFTYYGFVPEYPRPTYKTMLKDIRYMKEKINYLGSRNIIKSECTEKHAFPRVWDCNAWGFWVMAEMLWTMPESTDELLDVYLKRVFGPAASAMREFIRLTDEHFWTAPGASEWTDPAPLLWKQLVVEPGMAESCRQALDKAFAAATDEKAKAWIRRIQEIMDGNIAAAEYSAVAVRATGNVEFDPDFNTGAWKNASVICRFSQKYDGQGILSTLKDDHDRFLKIIFDDRNLYVGYRLAGNVPDLEVRPLPVKNNHDHLSDNWHRVSFDIHSSGNTFGKNYSFIADIGGNTYDSVSQAPWSEWNSGFTVQNCIRKNVWSIMLTIPLASINLNPESDESCIRATLYKDGCFTLGMAYGNSYAWPELVFQQKKGNE